MGDTACGVPCRVQGQPASSMSGIYVLAAGERLAIKEAELRVVNEEVAAARAVLALSLTDDDFSAMVGHCGEHQVFPLRVFSPSPRLLLYGDQTGGMISYHLNEGLGFLAPSLSA
eukprot:gene1053-biopygen346